MAWERRRHGRLFYYRARRVGARIIKEYVGAGTAGEQAAREDAVARAERTLLRSRAAARREQLQALEALVINVGKEAARLLEGALLAAGYYRHHRQWRRRRATKTR